MELYPYRQLTLQGDLCLLPSFTETGPISEVGGAIRSYSSSGKENLMQRTPLYPFHAELGATFTLIADWEVPDYYTNSQEETLAVRKRAGWCDLSYRGKIRLSGKDRVRFLHNLVSNDIQKLQVGEGCYTLFLEPKGHIITDMRVYALEDSLLIETEPGQETRLAHLLDRYRFREKVTIETVTEQWGILSINGPLAQEWVSQLLGQPIGPLPENYFGRIEWRGEEILLVGTFFTGETGFHLWVGWEQIAEVARELWRLRPEKAQAIGYQAWETLRIEAGIPRLGPELNEKIIPLEAELYHAISETKGCYIGQEVIARILSRGHTNRSLRGLRVKGNQVPQPGNLLFAEGKEIGWITSATWSPTLEQPIALAYVRQEYAQPGTTIKIQRAEKRISAQVVQLPFYPGAGQKG